MNAKRVGNQKRWEVSSVQLESHLISRSEYKLRVAEWAEVIYFQFSQLPDHSNYLSLEPLPLQTNAEEFEMQDAA